MATTTISGTGSVDDNMLSQQNPATNYYTYDTIVYQSVVSRGVIRFSSSLIPFGAITGFRVKLKAWATAADAVSIYRILAGNDWVTSQATWNLRKTGVSWLGGANGCSAAGD